MALQKAGIEPTVYEAHPTGADGVGVVPHARRPTAIDALRVLDADEPRAGRGLPHPGDHAAQRHRQAPRARAAPAATLPDGTTSHTLKRADLYRALHERGARPRHPRSSTASAWSRAHETGDGVRAVFADGSEATGDVLIGCDGIHSTVRRIIDPAAPAPTYAGLLTTGGYARGVAGRTPSRAATR